MSNYFNRVPDFEYVSRLPDANISDYIPVKNLFKRGQLREDIFQDLSVFTKYQIKGDDRNLRRILAQVLSMTLILYMMS